MRFLSPGLAAGLVLAAGASAALAQPPPSTTPAAPAAAPAGGPYTVETTDLGTMLDDPAAKAVLAKNLPDVINNPQIDMARGMTLKDLQQYSPDLTDQKLAKINADLAALPPKK